MRCPTSMQLLPGGKGVYQAHARILVYWVYWVLLCSLLVSSLLGPGSWANTEVWRTCGDAHGLCQPAWMLLRLIIHSCWTEGPVRPVSFLCRPRGFRGIPRRRFHCPNTASGWEWGAPAPRWRYIGSGKAGWGCGGSQGGLRRNDD